MPDNASYFHAAYAVAAGAYAIYAVVLWRRAAALRARRATLEGAVRADTARAASTAAR